MKTEILDFFIATVFIALMVAGEHYGIEQALNIAIFYAWSRVALRVLIIVNTLDDLAEFSGQIKRDAAHKTFYNFLFASQVLVTVFYGWFWLSGFMVIGHILLQCKYSQVIERSDLQKEGSQE